MAQENKACENELPPKVAPEEAREKAKQMSDKMDVLTASAAECILDWLEKEGADKPREEKLKTIAGRIEAACIMGMVTITLL